MGVISLHNKEKIEEFLQRNTSQNLYALGDLDYPFWPYTIWYALKPEQSEEIIQIALVYFRNEQPVLIATTDDLRSMRDLLSSIIDLLPPNFYAHLNSNMATLFSRRYNAFPQGKFYKMYLCGTQYESIDTSEVIPLSSQDVEEMRALYLVSYPEVQLDMSLLEIGFYYGIRRQGNLISVAGIHAYSTSYNIGIIGNVATHPTFRGQHLAETVCAKLCQALKMSVDNIGLHVKTNNKSAIAIYKRLGFEVVAIYEEYAFEERSFEERSFEERSFEERSLSMY